MTAAVWRSHIQLHLQSLPTTQGVNQIIFLSILRKMNISKLAIPVSQSAALAVSAACIFLFRLPPFRSDFSLPFPKQQGLGMPCCALSNIHPKCAHRQVREGSLHTRWCVSVSAVIIFLCSPSVSAELLPPILLHFHRHSSVTSKAKFGVCLSRCPHLVISGSTFVPGFMALLKPSQNGQLSGDFLHAATVPEGKRDQPPVSESRTCLHGGTPCALPYRSSIL